MTPEVLSQTQLADRLHLIDGNGEVSRRAVARLLRAPLARWGVSPRRAILKYARDQLRAAGLKDVACVLRVLDRMITLGECDETAIGSERYLAPSEPRWIAVGAGAGVILSVSGPPQGIRRVHSGNHRDIAQRIRVASDDDAAHLHLAGVREVSMAEWLTPVGYLRHATRRCRRPVRSDELSLAAFWDLLDTALAEEGQPLGSDADIRAVVGEPGTFFGRHDAPDLEGRWTAAPPEGIWCAVRRGYGDNHWHPTLISVHDERRRALDLYDFDEWQWALLARGQRVGPGEEVIRTETTVKLTFPPPIQLLAAMDIMGVPASAWTWDLQPDAPDVWTLVQ